jgi:hypothetical protein
MQRRLLVDLVGETGQVITMDVEEVLVEQAGRNLAAPTLLGSAWSVSMARWAGRRVAL